MQLLKFSGWSHIKLQYIEVIGMDQSPVKYRSILSKTSYKNRYNVGTSLQNQNHNLFDQNKVDVDNLLVFGYACKLFPPDDNSKMIRKMNHLIPWNGCEELMIDRYDCRGSLTDLSDFAIESWNKDYQVSEEEKRIEAKLDEERFKDLYKTEDELNPEEELKRLHASIATDGYNQVPMNYDTKKEDVYDPMEPTEEFEEETPFVAPKSLAVPSEMEIPATEKLNAVIEKTAVFVSKQGLQMEIVIKTKQANNSQFQFLKFDHYLNPYYKHMVKQVKSGKYNPENKTEANEECNTESDSDSDSDGGYLHPSLFANANKNKKEVEEKTKVINKVDSNHPLAKLIESRKAVNAIKKFEEQARNPQVSAKLVSTKDIDNSGTTSTISSETNNSNSVNSIMTTLKSNHIVPPPPDIQTFVEETVKRVVCEGENLEHSLLSSNRHKYGFLQAWHEYHGYYRMRKVYWLDKVKPPPPPEEIELDKPEEIVTASETVEQKLSGPISFAIKTKPVVSNKLLQQTQLQEEAKLDEEIEEIEEAIQQARKMHKEKMKEEENNIFKKVQASNSQPQVQGDVSQTTNQKQEKFTVSTVKDVLETKTTNQALKMQKSHAFTEVCSLDAITGDSPKEIYRIQKQAQRRQQALLFMKTKKQTSPKYQSVEEVEETSKKIEDIFDISDDDELDDGKLQSKNEKSKENFESVSTKATLLSTKVEKPLVCEIPIEVLEDLKNGNGSKKYEEKTTETLTIKDEIDTCVNNVISNKSSKKHKRKRHSSASSSGEEKHKKSKKRSKKSKKSSKKKKSKRNAELEVSYDGIPSAYRDASSSDDEFTNKSKNKKIKKSKKSHLK